jgi:hypothetical protein
MANLDLLVVESDKKKRKPSQDQNLTLQALTVGTSGATVLTQDGNGNWDFNAKRLSNVVSPTDPLDAMTLNYFNTYHLRSFVNVQGTIIMGGEIVYEYSPSSVKLAIASSSDITDGVLIGVVHDSYINNTTTGKILIKPGEIVGGYSGLVVKSPVYIHPTIAGAITQTTSGFLPGYHVISLGEAISSTEIQFEPKYRFEY